MRKITLLLMLGLMAITASAQKPKKAINPNPTQFKQYGTLEKIFLIMEKNANSKEANDAIEAFVKEIQQTNDACLSNTYLSKVKLNLPGTKRYKELADSLSSISKIALRLLVDSLAADPHVEGKTYKFMTPPYGLITICLDANPANILYGRIGVVCWTYNVVGIASEDDNGKEKITHITEIILADNIPSDNADMLGIYVKKACSDAKGITKVFGKKPPKAKEKKKKK